MGFRKVYFRIDSRYQFGSAWPDDEARTQFKAESQNLFRKAGWELQLGSDSVSDTVTKGQQELYLHPMNFSGVIQMDNLSEIKELLAQAQTFRCRGVDCYEEYFDLTDEAYWAQLESRREEITQAIMERFQTQRKNLYLTGPVSLYIAKQFSIHRLCDKEGKHNLANRFVGELVEHLIQKGHLVTAKTKQGPGIRTATPAELKALSHEQNTVLEGQQMFLS